MNQIGSKNHKIGVEEKNRKIYFFKMSIRTNHSMSLCPYCKRKIRKTEKNVFFALFFENLPKTKLNNPFIKMRAIGENVGASIFKTAEAIFQKYEFLEDPGYMEQFGHGPRWPSPLPLGASDLPPSGAAVPPLQFSIFLL